MGINGRLRQKTRRIWRHPQLFPYSYGVCTEEREDQRESKEERQCNISQRAALIAIGALDEKERDNVCPRCNRELYAFWTAAGAIMRCRGWDLTGTPCTLIKACQDEAVNFKDNIPTVQKMEIWRLVLVARPPVHTQAGRRVRCRDKTVDPKIQLSATTGQPRVGAKTIRSVAAHLQTIPTPSVPATARSVIQPGVVADVPITLSRTTSPLGTS